MNEYIYILSNPSMPNLIKVGKTTKHPSKRMSELHSTGVPTPFELEFSAIVNDCSYSERAAHQALSSYRVTGNREFFQVSVKTAIELILPIIGDYRIHDVKQTHDIEQICREVNRREQEKKQAELARKIARQQEEDRRNAEILAQRQNIEIKIRLEEQKLRQLGPRPIEKEFSSIGAILIACYFPYPIGWIVWFMALNVFGTHHQLTGFISLWLIISGFIYNKIHSKYETSFNIANRPFEEIDNVLNQLHKELDALPKIGQIF